MYLAKLVATISGLMVLALASSSTAAVMIFTDRPSFENAIVDDAVDTFNSPAYGLINSSAVMKALSSASIGYESTFFNQHNIVPKFKHPLLGMQWFRENSP